MFRWSLEASSVVPTPPEISRCGSISIPTGMRILFDTRSNWSSTLVTEPILMPRNSTGAPGLRPADRAVEIDQERDLLGVLRLAHRALGREQRKPGSGLGHHARAGAERRVELDAAGEKRLQRGDVHVNTRRAGADVDPAGVPEPAGRPHELVERFRDEDLDVQGAGVRGQLVGQHLADIDAPKVDRERPGSPSPSVAAVSVYSRPGTLALIGGGSSRPTKVLASPPSPGARPI